MIAIFFYIVSIDNLSNEIKMNFPFLHMCTHWSPTHLQQKASIKTSAKSCVNNSSKKSTQKDDADVIIESGIQIKLLAGKQIIFCFRKHFFALTYGSFWKLVENKIIYYLKLLIRTIFLQNTVENTDLFFSWYLLWFSSDDYLTNLMSFSKRK